MLEKNLKHLNLQVSFYIVFQKICFLIEFLPTLLSESSSIQIHSLSNEKHYSNTVLEIFNELIIPYIKSVHSSSDLPEDQYSLVIMDVFTQMTSDVLNLLRDNKILLTNVPPNMTKFYQPLDLTFNGYAKI